MNVFPPEEDSTTSSPIPPQVPGQVFRSSKVPSVSKYSLKSLKLKVFDEYPREGHELTEDEAKKRPKDMVATGFLVEINSSGDVVFVTNYHVVTWRTLEDEFVGDAFKSRTPRTLRVELPSEFERPDVPLFDELGRWEIELYDGEPGNLLPLWFQDGDHVRGELKPPITDVVVFPVERERARQLSRYVYSWDQADGLPLSITDVLFVVGYPKSVGTFVSSTPIWTRGSVASEPEMDPDDRFFIDSRTRPGQSGSPVIAYRPESTMISAGPAGQVEEKAILQGVYSGRTDKDSDIGSVWNMPVVERIAYKIPIQMYRGKPNPFIVG
ncbi:trypsin-like peptidase domain-containing protein [Pseudarthrobacter sp. S6]|uniref:trypsin-like peptidase domain-containing protein n=1 Tax=Pseudarthrobacter sp. S6 TaxID=3418420 RepID=UPI003CF8A668